MTRREHVVGLDVGTSKVAVVIGLPTQDGRIDIIGVGTCPSAGMRRGVVVDIEATVRAILEACQKAERMAGVSIKSVYTSVGGPHMATTNNRGVVAVSRQDREITPEDQARVMEAARVLNVPPDREIVHVLPRQFIVDGYDGVKDPVGMVGVRLEVEALIVTGAITSLQNILRCVYKAGLEVDGLVLSALAAGESVLQPAERELGVMLVDMGAGTTQVAIYDQGSLWQASVVPVGSAHITNDIAVGLRTPVQQAESIKVLHGRAQVGDTDDEAFFDIPSVAGSGQRQVSQRMLATIIEARAHEVLDLVAQQLKFFSYPHVLPAGAVLTGGGSRLTGMLELAGARLDMPVRTGCPVLGGGLDDIVRDPALATSVGLVIRALKDRETGASRLRGGGRAQSWIAALANWFREFL
ncbi:MAG: cell division protein FtsA [Bacillota bacterium]